MRQIGFVLLFLLGSVYCQDYMNVQFTSETKHSLLDDISEITFSSDDSDINFILTGGSTVTESVDDIVQIVFGATALGDVSLPVELVSFTAFQSDNSVTLLWETASEIENYGFEIERIHNGVNDWKKVGFVEGNGSVSSTSEYSFTDKNISRLTHLRYRLKQIDYDGSFEYSHEISVSFESRVLPEKFALHNNYPNPFNPETTIRYELIRENITKLTVYDMLGKEVEILVNKNQLPGKYEINFNGAHCSSGVYFCKLSSGNYSQLQKMLLVK